MGKKILIIEDNETHFMRLKKWLEENEENNFEVLPDNFTKMSKAFNPNCNVNLDDFISELVSVNYKDLKLVLCDIQLGEENSGGCEIVKTICELKEVYSSYLFGLPIIAITEYTNRQTKILDAGASLSIEKKRIELEPELIMKTIIRQINDFETNIKAMRKIKEKQKVFIVHGHAGIEESVAYFLTRLNLQPIILREQTDNGATIIEKIENYSNVDYAVVLYTSCDMGRLKEEDNSKLRPRARQNVIFEHGYLTSSLGRKNVSILLEKDVEKPGDIDGLLYIPYDESGSWKYRLAKNMKDSGLDIDMNLL